MRIHFLRHATLIVEIAGMKILVDPMLSPAGAMPPVKNAANQRPIPLVALPVSDGELSRLLADLDIVLVTHTHRDHWDQRAIELLRKDIPILCQPEDEAAIREAGFTAVVPITDHLAWRGEGLDFYRTGGQHGTGEIGAQMGAVSGFVLVTSSGPELYIAGDTIWCPEVQRPLREYKPRRVIVNAGAAQFLVGDPITMTAADVAAVCRELPNAQVIAVHMEAINHCLLSRADLRRELEAQGLSDRVLIPADGEVIE